MLIAIIDVWRNAPEPSTYKWGWSLVALLGQLTLPGWQLSDGWYAAIPLGALAYLVLARSGPVRRLASNETR